MSETSESLRPPQTLGPILVAAAALLWGTDALFRAPVVKLIHPIYVVLFEHLVGTLLVGAWAFLRNRERFGGFRPATWFSLWIVGAGGSALATVLFTASFRLIDNPSVAILLQKLQPVFVTLLAFVFLRELPKGSFWRWAPVAAGAGIVLSFPGLDFTHFKIDWNSQGVLYALVATFLWSASTVGGKAALAELDPVVVTFWRYFFGLLTLAVLALFSGESIPLQALHEPAILHSLLYMAFLPGLFALIFYYNGLKSTPASSATFIELLFPVSAVVLNWYFLKSPLNLIQILSSSILLYSVCRI